MDAISIIVILIFLIVFGIALYYYFDNPSQQPEDGPCSKNSDCRRGLYCSGLKNCQEGKTGGTSGSKCKSAGDCNIGLSCVSKMCSMSSSSSVTPICLNCGATTQVKRFSSSYLTTTSIDGNKRYLTITTSTVPGQSDILTLQETPSSTNSSFDYSDKKLFKSSSAGGESVQFQPGIGIIGNDTVCFLTLQPGQTSTIEFNLVKGEYELSAPTSNAPKNTVGYLFNNSQFQLIVTTPGKTGICTNSASQVLFQIEPIN